MEIRFESTEQLDLNLPKELNAKINVTKKDALFGGDIIITLINVILPTAADAATLAASIALLWGEYKKNHPTEMKIDDKLVLNHSKESLTSMFFEKIGASDGSSSDNEEINDHVI